MVSVGYNALGQLAKLTVDKPDEGWIRLRRLYDDHCAEIEYASETEILLPWWSFLSLRKRLLYVVKRYSIEIKFEEKAKKLLQNAIDREETFIRVSEVKPLDEKDVREELVKVGFIRRLTPEQLRNVSRIAPMPGAATFSVPGAGKTTEALAYFFFTKAEGTRLLVIAPINAFSSWEEQLDICMGEGKYEIIRLTGGLNNISESLADKPDLMIMSYHQFARIEVRNLVARYITEKPTYLFLDESHRIKRGIEGKIGSMILSISHLPVRKLILTGTPLPNSLEDLVPQLNFLYPEIEVTSSTVSSNIQSIYVRTTKRELNLPPVTHVITKVSMGPSQRRLYNLIRWEEARRAEKIISLGTKERLRQMGRGVMRIILIASNPGILASDPNFPHNDLLAEVLEEGDSTKVAWVCKRARELAGKGRKVIIWTSFVRNVELIANRLSDFGAEFIHGGVIAGSEEEENTREAKLKRFHEDPNALVLVANPAAAGEGISLHTVCHNAIYLDRTYNAAHYLQSEDRIHRLGLPQDVETLIEIMMAKKSIDESINIRLMQKIEMMSKVLDDRSLQINPIEYDPESEGFDEDDMNNYLKHLQESAPTL
ncbi:MAG: DEAD/DEAH box helicase [Planctomycetes bacterium]|nr:DEAD/DEAH box helicase [Planctomycetota bacterium]